MRVKDSPSPIQLVQFSLSLWDWMTLHLTYANVSGVVKVNIFVNEHLSIISENEGGSGNYLSN